MSWNHETPFTGEQNDEIVFPKCQISFFIMFFKNAYNKIKNKKLMNCEIVQEFSLTVRCPVIRQLGQEMIVSVLSSQKLEPANMFQGQFFSSEFFPTSGTNFRLGRLLTLKQEFFSTSNFQISQMFFTGYKIHFFLDEYGQSSPF